MMKTRYFIGLAALTLLVAACEKEVEDNGVAENNAAKTYTAVMEQISDDTRSSVTTAGVFSWEIGDQIAVVGESIENTASLTVTDGVGTFTTSVETPVYATYPRIAKSYSEGTLTVTLPSSYGDSETVYKASTNAAMLADMSATGEQTTETVTFNHLGSVLLIRLSDVPVGANKLVFTTDQKISGDFAVSDLAGTPVISTSASESDNTVTFNFKAVESVQTEMDFYVPLPEGTYTRFDIELYNKNNVKVYSKKTGASATGKRIARKQLIILPVLPVTHEYVDLGLSVLWATTNVGADSPEDYGDYFAWGEVAPETGANPDYDWDTYDLAESSYFMTKYSDTDNMKELEAVDDAATANWGGDWRMPTKDELKELNNSSNCKWTWDSVRKGYVVTSLKSGYTDKSIFLPAAGYYLGTALYRSGSDGYYWSSIRTDSDDAYGGGLYFDSGKTGIDNNARYQGKPVRPICPKSE